MLSVKEQVKRALDGRTRRWLSLKIGVPESDVSRKLNPKDKAEFTDEEIMKINEVLKVKIKKS